MWCAAAAAAAGRCARSFGARQAEQALAAQRVDLDVAVVERQGEQRLIAAHRLHHTQAIDAAVHVDGGDGRAHDAQVPQLDRVVVAGGGDLVVAHEYGAVDAALVALVDVDRADRVAEVPHLEGGVLARGEHELSRGVYAHVGQVVVVLHGAEHAARLHVEHVGGAIPRAGAEHLAAVGEPLGGDARVRVRLVALDGRANQRRVGDQGGRRGRRRRRRDTTIRKVRKFVLTVCFC